MSLLIDFSVILVLIAGIALFREPRQARVGNGIAAMALMTAVVLVFHRNGILDTGTVMMALLLGAVAGAAVAQAANMIQIPAIVAFQHGAGGVAAFLVSFVELTRGAHALAPAGEISGLLGLTIGALTFSGSMIASAKLANLIRQPPQILPGHSILLMVNVVSLGLLGTLSFIAAPQWTAILYLAQIVLAVTCGILFSIRIGGADMPVLISFLNATAGLAAALCGMVIAHQLLIAFGATVAASGSILTHVMCKAMNRNIGHVFLPRTDKRPAEPEIEGSPAAELQNANPDNGHDLEKAAALLKEARQVVLVPGYGMALAKAQQEVAALANFLITTGKEVKYAIHPVAGRMPGHMNVLLAEVGVDYDRLVEMEAINPQFPSMDAVVVVGACDVVNPAAIDIPGTPISGMPILNAHLAKSVVCCNFDRKPGYSGVDNPLYRSGKTLMLCGDAKETLHRLTAMVKNGAPAESTAGRAPSDRLDRAARVLAAAGKVIIIPGYGMALAKAQFGTVKLASRLQRNGATVKFAIHPVAGRMPGHMNVILAEAEVDYDDLIEMEDVNPQFTETDAALVVGACDVVNPAAIETQGTPISGMPVLLAHQARHVIVCNLDDKPGYSGVPNPLYTNANTIPLFGDAEATLRALMQKLEDCEPPTRLYFDGEPVKRARPACAADRDRP